MERKCAVCGVNAPQSCGGCSKVSYCSREHQKQHWKTHKNDCSFFAIEDTPEMGKGFVATRDIKPGTIIWEEMPVAGAPDWEDKALSSEPCCVTCGFVMKGTRRMCSKCKWPSCSRECENDPAHAYECELFHSTHFKFPPVRSPLKEIVSSRMFIMIVRVLLLKRKDPELYAQVLQLHSEYGIGMESLLDRLLSGDTGFAELMNEPMDWPRTLGLEVSFKELLKLHRIIQINRFARTIVSAWIDINSREITLLYLKSSRMNNSCTPNCCWRISEKPEYKFRVSTATAVKKGEPLTICYDSRQSEVGTRKRQEGFQQGPGFICKCARCTDPTELGTFMSGVVCSDCHAPDKHDTGYFLPRVPWDLSKTAIWECNGCGKTAPASALFPVESLADEVAKLFKSVMEKRVGFCTLLEFCETLMAKYQGKVLHPNHWVIQDAARAVFNLAWKDAQSVEIATNERFVQLGLYLLRIQDKVSPGLSGVRARLQQVVAYCLSYLAVNLMSQGNYEMAAQHIESGLRLRKEVLKYSKNDFPGPDWMESEKVQENMNKDLQKLGLCKIHVAMKAMASGGPPV